MAISTSTERVRWHENLPRSNIESHPKLQDRRLLEYVCLGDYNTAVGFLLASAPEASIRYYRDSLCALALAAAQQSSSGDVEPTGSLHLQVAKVVSAHAASVSDPLLGVPLLCSAGLPNAAVSLLQDSGLWRYAATLTAARLEGRDHALSCLRWAQHVLVAEGSVWRSVGILVSGGCFERSFLAAEKKRWPIQWWAIKSSIFRVEGLQPGSSSGSPDEGKRINQSINHRRTVRVINDETSAPPTTNQQRRRRRRWPLLCATTLPQSTLLFHRHSHSRRRRRTFTDVFVLCFLDVTSLNL
ncbi:hypothetical protein BSKO_11932 [Bryopsis sp. KO-2023]|nr:hypothetical protein BSKO_11932 [Bryopsis sp. KO-2023]